MPTKGDQTVFCVFGGRFELGKNIDSKTGKITTTLNIQVMSYVVICESLVVGCLVISMNPLLTSLGGFFHSSFLRESVVGGQG